VRESHDDPRGQVLNPVDGGRAYLTGADGGVARIDCEIRVWRRQTKTRGYFRARGYVNGRRWIIVRILAEERDETAGTDRDGWWGHGERGTIRLRRIDGYNGGVLPDDHHGCDNSGEKRQPDYDRK